MVQARLQEALFWFPAGESLKERDVAEQENAMRIPTDEAECERLKKQAEESVSVPVDTPGVAMQSGSELCIAGELYQMCLDLGVSTFRASNIDGAFALYPSNGRFIVGDLRGEGFGDWLINKYFAQTRRVAGVQSISGALSLLRSGASRERKKLFIRWGHDKDAVYLDLGREDYRVARITEKGWNIADESPVLFYRPRAALEMPLPEHGGSLDSLRKYFSASEGDFVLIVGWLLASCNPRGPFPILVLNAEQGCGKSTATSILGRLLDPSIGDRLSIFKSDDDLIAAAASRWMLAYDNLRGISHAQSDSLCRLATGGGLSKRALYTNNDSFSAEVTRPCLCNGIAFEPSQLDLLDRIYPVRLSQISKKKTEASLYADFERERPKLLGALLTAVAGAMREQDDEPEIKSRMIDAALWVWRAEESGCLPWARGTWRDTLERSERSKHRELLEYDTLAMDIIDLAKIGWRGTIKELQRELLSRKPMDERQYLPQTPHSMGRKLTELMPLLRGQGVELLREKKGELGYIVRLAMSGAHKESSESAGVLEINDCNAL
jgi:hypothetical protein